MYEPLAPARPEAAASQARSERGCYIVGFLLVAGLIAGGGVGLGRMVRSKVVEPTAEDYLRIVDEFLDTRPRQTFIPKSGGLLQVFGPGSYGGGSCGKLCTLSESCPFSAVRGLCRFDVYDNALAAIYYTARNKVRSCAAASPRPAPASPCLASPSERAPPHAPPSPRATALHAPRPPASSTRRRPSSTASCTTCT